MVKTKKYKKKHVILDNILNDIEPKHCLIKR